MKKRRRQRFLSLMLVLCMIASAGMMTPLNTSADSTDVNLTEETQQAESALTGGAAADQIQAAAADTETDIVSVTQNQETMTAADTQTADTGALPEEAAAPAAEQAGDGTEQSDPAVTESANLTETPSESQAAEGKTEESADGTQGTESTDAPAADKEQKTEQKQDSEETEVSWPAQTFTGHANNITVNVTAAEGIFPEGTTMVTTAVSAQTAKAIANAASDAEAEVVDAIGVDISFRDASGNEIEPKDGKNVQVRMTVDAASTLSGDSFSVVHQSDNGNVQKVTENATAEGAVFESGEFSIYVITGEGLEQKPAIATYYFHDADGNQIDVQKVKDGETVYAPTTPEKSGSKFLGWSYAQGASSIQEGDPGNFGTLTASVSTTGDVRLYSVFQQVYYVFFFDNQGRVSTTKEGASGDVISVEDVVIPLDSTHSVTGWYTESEHVNKVDSITLADHNVTLYPKVEEGNYLYFSSGEGASYVKPVFVAAGKNTVKPEAPTRPGYTFKHWSASEGGSEYAFGSTISEDSTLHAVWEANLDTQYTVIYWWENANDNNYSYHENSTATGITGSKIDLDGIKKDYDGFTRNAEKTNAANLDAVIAGDGSTIVNVYYSRNTYEIKFYKGERQGGWFGGYYSWDEMTGLSISAKYGANISDRWPTSTSKIWGTQQGENGQGAGPYQSGISTMPLNGAAFYYVSQTGSYTMNLHYYVEGLDGKYYLHHTDSFKSDNNEWSTTKEDHYDIEGFTYTNNVKDGSRFERVNRNVYKVSFEYSRNSYSIKFVNRDSTTSETFKYGADVSKVDLTAAPERPAGIPSGYVFAGWFDNELGVGDLVTLTGTMPAHNITLYAKWAAPTYTGTVHTTMDGTDTPIQITINYGSKINENDMPIVKDSDGNIIQEGSSSHTVTVPQGNTWAGWATKSGDDFTIYNFNTQVYSDITLYPYYINGGKYTVTYILGEGTGTAPTDSKQYSQNAYADIQPASGITPPEGKTFLYWSHGTDKYYPGDKVKITGDLELNAVYGDTSALTSITYHSNYPKGSGLDELTTKIDNQANNTAIALEKAGFAAPDKYYFAYWKDASGKRYDVGTKIGIDNSSANNLYAVWEQKKEITLTANSGEFTYDGTEHTVSGVKKNTFTIDNVTYTVSGFTTQNPKETNAGTYTNNILNTDSIVVKNGDTDVTYQFTVKTENGSLKITPKAVTVTADSIGKTYGEKDPELTAKVSGTLGNDTVRYTLSREKGEAVGTYTITPTGEANQGNYTVTYETGTFTISKSGSLTLTANGYEGEYDGKSHAASARASVTEGTTISYQVGNGEWTTEAPSIKDVGEQTVNVKAENANYETASTTVTLKVTPKEVTVTAGNKGKTYGAADPELTATVSGTLDNDTVRYTLSRAEGENVGTYAITPTGEASQGNYAVTYVPGTLTISKSGTLTLTANGYESEYDGKSHAASANASVTEGTTISYQVGNGEWTTEAPSIKDVGEQTVNVKAENANYETAETTVMLKVTPKAVTITSGSGSWPYDSKTHSVEMATAKGFVGSDGAAYSNFATITEKGTKDNTFDYTLTKGTNSDNYKIEQNYGQLEITAADEAHITITGNTDTQTYDGIEKTVSGYTTTDLPAGITVSLKEDAKAAAKGTDAGEYPMSLTEESFEIGGTDNYKKVTVTVKDGVLTINKKQITLKSGSASKKYDKEPLTNHTLVLGNDIISLTMLADKNDLTIADKDKLALGIAEKDQITFNFTGSQTLVGSSANTFEYTISEKAQTRGQPSLAEALKTVDPKEEDDKVSKNYTENYEISLEFGELEVTDNEVTPDKVVTKTHEDKTYQIGDSIEFTINVTNIYDDVRTIILQEQDGVAFEDGADSVTFENVKPGETISAKAVHVVTAADIEAGEYSNTVKAVFKKVGGSEPGGNPDEPGGNPDEPGKTWEASDTEDDFAHMTISKEVTSNPKNGSKYVAGETVTYLITVTNDGTVTLKELVITDDLTNATWTADSLNAGETLTYTTSYKVTEADAERGSVTNVVAGKADGLNTPDPGTATVTTEAEESEEPENPEPTQPTKPEETVTPTPLVTVPPTELPSTRPVHTGNTIRKNPDTIQEQRTKLVHTGAVRTGDAGMIGVNVIIVLGAAAGIGVLIRKRKKEKKQ